MDTRLVHPFTSIGAGPTGCGETTFVVSLLRHSLTLINLPPEKITWCYGEWQPLYSTLSTIHPNLECVEGLPDVSSFDSKNRFVRLKASSIEWVNQGMDEGREEWRHLADSVVTDGAT